MPQGLIILRKIAVGIDITVDEDAPHSVVIAFVLLNLYIV